MMTDTHYRNPRRKDTVALENGPNWIAMCGRLVPWNTNPARGGQASCRKCQSAVFPNPAEGRSKPPNRHWLVIKGLVAFGAIATALSYLAWKMSGWPV